MANITPESVGSMVIHHISGKYFVWNGDAVFTLRTKHRVCGHLVGSTPRKAWQATVHSLPLILTPAEAHFCYRSGIAKIVDGSDYFIKRKVKMHEVLDFRVHRETVEKDQVKIFKTLREEKEKLLFGSHGSKLSRRAKRNLAEAALEAGSGCESTDTDMHVAKCSKTECESVGLKGNTVCHEENFPGQCAESASESRLTPRQENSDESKSKGDPDFNDELDQEHADDSISKGDPILNVDLDQHADGSKSKGDPNSNVDLHQEHTDESKSKGYLNLNGDLDQEHADESKSKGDPNLNGDLDQEHADESKSKGDHNSNGDLDQEHADESKSKGDPYLKVDLDQEQADDSKSKGDPNSNSDLDNIVSSTINNCLRPLAETVSESEVESELNWTETTLSESDFKYYGPSVYVHIPTDTTSKHSFMSYVTKYPMSEREKCSCAVYEDLHRRGFFVTSSLKFGGDFLVYLGDPLRHHSHYIVVVLNKDDAVTAKDLITYGRLSASVKKTVVLATLNCDMSTVDYLSLTWAQMK